MMLACPTRPILLRRTALGMALDESKRGDVEREPLTPSFARHRLRRRPRFYFYMPWLSVGFWALLLLSAALLTCGLVWAERLSRLSTVLVRAHCLNLRNSSTLAVSRCVQRYTG